MNKEGLCEQRPSDELLTPTPWAISTTCHFFSRVFTGCIWGKGAPFLIAKCQVLWAAYFSVVLFEAGF